MSQSFVTPPAPRGEQDLESGIVESLQEIGGHVLELNDVLTGGSLSFDLEDYKRFEKEKDIVRPVIHEVIKVTVHTETATKDLMQKVRTLAAARAKIEVFVALVKNERKRLIPNAAKDAIQAHKDQRVILEQICVSIENLARKWGEAAEGAVVAKDKMSKRVLEAQAGYDQAWMHLKSLLLSPGAALAVAGCVVALFTLMKLWNGEGEIGLLVASLSVNIFGMIKAAPWTSLLDDGLGAAAKHLGEAISMEREVSRVLHKLKTVEAALNQLHEAVQKQANEGTTLRSEFLNPEHEGRRCADGTAYREFTVQMDQCSDDLTSCEELVDELHERGVDELTIVEERLAKRTENADNLLKQLLSWETNSRHVRSTMSVLMNATYGSRMNHEGIISRVSHE